MVDRGADDRQPDRDVHAFLDSVELDRDQPLIMILRHDDVEFAASSPHEDRIRRERAGNIHPRSLRLLDRRGDDLDFLAAEQAAFARMRVQPGDGNARLGDPECLAAFLRQSE